MKKNDAFTNFLDTKFIPLERKIKLLLLVLIFVIPAVAYYFFFLDPNMKEIDQLTAKKSGLEQELQKVKSRARDLPKLQAELARIQIEFDKKSALLPREKEIPNLLRDISALGTNSGLDFLKFKPLPTVPRDFYNDVPVSINVRGPYHSVGSFFDRVSKLERIVSVTNIRMSSPKLEGGEMLLNSDCQLVTYQFTDKELPKDPKKKK
ncbi:type IV pilus inner membrane component PilO [Desulfopila aestuarii]|uniref:Type IV pilus assembly protein PilO n=1 Tax=Desulfopila aestuarii DSM 18488 TaxID=1121416 RepID=A0A1M7YHA8_9BACT|nr:type 4a pilus biogenesis protein PilO [Desulfopila aestuarii]SHO51971.1 type IV pilus assembly protein PilO [Desulfopila aestuarii DSM 18488]